MRVYFGTVVRGAPVREAGEIVCVDWESRTVLHRAPVIPDNPDVTDDPNPRGNTRGCKGIVALGDRIIAASYHSLHTFDRDLNPLDTVSHGLMVGLHEIHVAEGGVWVASTAIDAALKYLPDSGGLVMEYWPRGRPIFQAALGLVPFELDRTADHRRSFIDESHRRSVSHLHLNAVAVRGGHLYALCHSFGVVLDLTAEKIVIRDPRLKGAHNLVFLDDRHLAINDTYGRAVRIYDTSRWNCTNEIRLCSFQAVRELGGVTAVRALSDRMLRRLPLAKDTMVNPHVAQLFHFIRGGLLKRKSPLATPLFVRGLALADGKIFVGVSPASVLCIDPKTASLEGVFQYSQDRRVSIHGLTACS